MNILNCVPTLQNLNGGPTICVLNILNLMNNNNYKVDLLVGSKIEKSFLMPTNSVY